MICSRVLDKSSPSSVSSTGLNHLHLRMGSSHGWSTEIHPIGSVPMPWDRIRVLTVPVLAAVSFPRNPWYVSAVVYPLTLTHYVFQSLVLNLGISPGWQKIDPSTLTFPTEMLIDYVRVYQRKGYENVGCSPVDYPTADYINKHSEAYNSEPSPTYVHHRLLT